MSQFKEIPTDALPEQLLVNKQIDWHLVRNALGLLTDDRLKDMLLYLYRIDWRVGYYVNDALLRMAVPALSKKYVLPIVPPTDQEAAWLSADLGCETCPGSEYIDYEGGLTYPKCANINRPERYTHCLKYRENLIKAEISPDEADILYDQVVKVFKELHNVYFPRAKSTIRERGSLDTNCRSVGNNAERILRAFTSGNS